MVLGLSWASVVAQKSGVPAGSNANDQVADSSPVIDGPTADASTKSADSEKPHNDAVTKKTQNPRPKNSAQSSKSQHSQERSDEYKKRVATELKSKKITQAQADILNKQIDELSQFRLDLSVKPKDERLTLRTQKREEMTKWAKDNNLPTYLLRGLI